MTKVTLNVPDISCGHCKESIEGAVKTLEGVEAVEVHIAERTVDVAFDEGRLPQATIVETIEEQGYAVAS